MLLHALPRLSIVLAIQRNTLTLWDAADRECFCSLYVTTFWKTHCAALGDILMCAWAVICLVKTYMY
jgi:hypothetical protein